MSRYCKKMQEKKFNELKTRVFTTFPLDATMYVVVVQKKRKKNRKQQNAFSHIFFPFLSLRYVMKQVVFKQEKTFKNDKSATSQKETFN